MSEIAKLNEISSLHKALHYCPDTGEFTWKSRGQRLFDEKLAGKLAGVIDREGYRRIVFGGKYYRAARLAYAFMTGKWPDVYVDHINGRRADDRWVNLREADFSQNSCNTSKQSNNKTGFKGVAKRNRGKPYEATIMHNGKHHYLGTFHTAEEAHAAYCTASEKLHGAFGNAG